MGPSRSVAVTSTTVAWSYIGERMTDRLASQMVLEALDGIEGGA